MKFSRYITSIPRAYRPPPPAHRRVTSRKVNALIDIAFHDIYFHERDSAVVVVVGELLRGKRAMSASGSLFCLRVGSMRAQLVRDDELREYDRLYRDIPNDDANSESILRK